TRRRSGLSGKTGRARASCLLLLAGQRYTPTGIRSIVQRSMATRTLLCVEPDGKDADFIRNALVPYGFEVKTIANGEQAIEWGRRNRPQVIIVCVEPRKVGYAICNKIKRSDELKDVPLILTSAEETRQTFDQHKKLRSHAEEYILKPLQRNELLSKIKQLVGLSGEIGPGETSEEPSLEEE